MLCLGRFGCDGLSVVVGFVAGGGGAVPAAVEQGVVAVSVVVPVDSFEGGELDVAEPVPGSSGVDQLPFGQVVGALGRGVVVAVVSAVGRGDDVVVDGPL